MADLLPSIEINPSKLAVGSVIWLHGLGADGNDFKPIVPALNLPNDLPLRFVFPHAPVRPVSINGGAPTRAWFDIDLPSLANEDHLNESVAQLNQLIQREINLGIPSYQIVLAGFSQGGVIALQAGLLHDQPLAGIMALSTFLPSVESLKTTRHDSNRSIKIFMAHGTNDSMIPIAMAKAARSSLEEFQYPLEWNEYPMGHEVCPGEIKAISQWLQRRFSL
ncbi:MAG: carboxylesterase [Gammaproteobacteria bacterium]|nr:carboxylesterase [Gammaproteobacteria bacterium]